MSSPEHPTPRPRARARRRRRRLALAVAAVALAVVVAALAWPRGAERTELDLAAFEAAVAAGDVASATIHDRSDRVTGELADGTAFEVTYPARYVEALTAQLLDAGVPLEVDGEGEPLWQTLLYELLPVLVLLGAFAYLLSSLPGGQRALSFGRSTARAADPAAPTTTFADVAGADEAVEELREISDFLAHPARFGAIGARIPRGVLLYGPPGTGKTLLARAVAGEAAVPFFTISGSDFVELFVGVGASRVRDLFEQAKEAAPCIVFIDEIDAVGRHRGAGVGGGHDEREQTLNQLLVELDGFDADTGVILIAATNRPDILDPALLRPGRFDRQIAVDRPDLAGRRAILAVHAEGKPLAGDADLDVVARRTPGFTGADLANLLNEAALLAARQGRSELSRRDLAEAVDRVVAGPERRTRVIAEREKRVIAYHEGGHAIVGHVLPNTHPIHKVSIIARGRALGSTLALPTEDRHLQTRAELRDEMAMLMGGRTAEELIFGDPTTGAMNDIERATEIARAMVTQLGMSDVVGPQQLGHPPGEVFLGRDQGRDLPYSDHMASVIDAEVRRLLDDARAEAREILVQHRAALDRLADALVERESLEEADLAELLGGLDPWEPTTPVGAADGGGGDGPTPHRPPVGPDGNTAAPSGGSASTSRADGDDAGGRADPGPPPFPERP